MRRLLLIVVLLVMVPLRTWAGDAMAIQMAPPTHAASAISVHAGTTAGLTRF